MDNNELKHWGIRGMKWGKRRYQNKDGSLTPEGKKRYGDDDGESDEPKKTKYLSDAEIRNRINRLKLEKEYADLVKQSKPASKGKAFVSDVLKTSGKNIATQLTTYAMGAAVNASIKAKTSGKAGSDFTSAFKESFTDAFKDGNIVNPRKGQKDK